MREELWVPTETSALLGSESEALAQDISSEIVLQPQVRVHMTIPKGQGCGKTH